MRPQWYPWYPALYRGDTLHLTAAQDGVYRRLIDHYMETRKPLPNHPQALAAIARISVTEWENFRSTLLPFFQVKNDRLFHKRCDNVLSAQDTRSERLSEIGRQGAIAKHSKKKDIAGDGPAEAIAPAVADAVAPAVQERERKKEDPVVPSENPSLDLNLIYAWAGKTIRLKKADYDQWRKVYSAIPDFDAELQRIDDSLTAEGGHRGKWFPAASAMLGFKHQQFQAKRTQTMNGTPTAKLSVAKKSALMVEWKMERASPKALRERAIKEGLGEVWE